MATNPAKARSFYGCFPYIARLAMACEESELFLQSTEFLEAPTAEEAMQRHLEHDAQLADKYFLGDPRAIWQAAQAIDADRIRHHARLAAAVILMAMALSGSAGAFGYNPKLREHPAAGRYCIDQVCADPRDWPDRSEPTD